MKKSAQTEQLYKKIHFGTRGNRAYASKCVKQQIFGSSFMNAISVSVHWKSAVQIKLFQHKATNCLS